MMLIYTDCATVREARNIGRTLVREGLVACASWWRVTATYRWQGRPQEKGEVALLCKTSERAYPKVTRRLRELHGYDLPSLITWRSQANQPYERWVKQLTFGLVPPGGTRSTKALRPSLVRHRPARG